MKQQQSLPGDLGSALPSEEPSVEWTVGEEVNVAWTIQVQGVPKKFKQKEQALVYSLASG